MKFFAAFISTFACVFAHAPAPGYPGSYDYAAAPVYSQAYKYVPAQITVLPSGYLADTPEVAHSKGAHSVAQATAEAVANPDYISPSVYVASAHATPVYASQAYSAPVYVVPVVYSAPLVHYPPAKITGLPSGFLADTPEVSRAKETLSAANLSAAKAKFSLGEFESAAEERFYSQD